MDAWTIHVVSGRTVSLTCSEEKTVADLQEMLASITGIDVRDQVITCNKAPLTRGSRLLTDLRSQLPSPTPPMFLYSKHVFRPETPFPEDEVLPPPVPGYDGADVPYSDECAASSDSWNRRTSDGEVFDGTSAMEHPLSAAASPLLRALPQYREEFARHARRAATAAEAGATRVALCRRCIEECEVRALCVDAAMESVEPTYDSICEAQRTFLDNFKRKYDVHEDILASFEADMSFLHSITLPSHVSGAKKLQGHTQMIDLKGGGGKNEKESSTFHSYTTLAGFIDVQSLSQLAAESRKSHRRFAARVVELQSMHKELQSEVEALFMRAPSVDLSELSHGLEAAHLAAQEQEAAAQAMQAGLQRAEAAMERGVLVSEGVPQSTGYSAIQDSIAALEAIHEAHTTDMQPRIAACAEVIEAFAAKCVSSRNAFVKDAVTILRAISSQQNRIRSMREALTPFADALERQDARMEQLLMPRKLATCYKHALAECARRSAFADKFAAFAADLAEKMGKFREKELSVRSNFRHHVKGILPGELLSAMGLDAPPPHCEVNVSGNDKEQLWDVKLDDLKRYRLPWRSIPLPLHVTPPLQSSKSGGSSKSLSKLGGNVGASSTSNPFDVLLQRTGHISVEQSPRSLDDQNKPLDPVASSLAIENARLRADLASHVALECVRLMELPSILGAMDREKPCDGAVKMRESFLERRPSSKEQKEDPSIESSSEPGKKVFTGVSPMARSGTTTGGSSSLSSAVSSGAEVIQFHEVSDIASHPAAFQLPTCPPEHPDMVAKFQRALAAKDAVIDALQKQLERYGSKASPEGPMGIEKGTHQGGGYDVSVEDVSSDSVTSERSHGFS